MIIHGEGRMSDSLHNQLLRDLELGNADRYKRRPRKVELRDELTVLTVRRKLHQLYLWKNLDQWIDTNMVNSQLVEKFRRINDFPELVEYLGDELDWPIQAHQFEEMTFDYTPAELGLDE